MRKLKRQSGETLAETLVSMLIISLAALILAGSVTTAARVNRKAEDMAGVNPSTAQIPENPEEFVSAGIVSASVFLDGAELCGVIIKAKTSNGETLYYYEKNP